jgi:hypothetical protein
MWRPVALRIMKEPKPGEAPMDVTKATELVGAYEALLDRAYNVVEGAPYWAGAKAYVDQDHMALHIAGDTATFSWAATDSADDSCTLERHKLEFPASLLFLGEEEFSAWKEDERRKYDAEMAALRETAIRVREDQERALLAQLQAKYQHAT